MLNSVKWSFCLAKGLADPLAGKRHVKWVPKIAGRPSGRAADRPKNIENGGAREARATISDNIEAASGLARGSASDFGYPFCMPFFLPGGLPGPLPGKMTS